MEKAYNGWTASPDARAIGGLDNRVVPGTTVRLAPGIRNGDVATVLFYVAERWNATVEMLRDGWCWGFNYRQNRNAKNLSCHAAACAADFNSPLHPNGKRGTFSPEQVRAIRAILAECDGVVQWGGDFTGTPDEMHVEVVGTVAAVARLAKKIRNPTTRILPPIPKEVPDMDTRQDQYLTDVRNRILGRDEQRYYKSDPATGALVVSGTDGTPARSADMLDIDFTNRKIDALSAKLDKLIATLTKGS